MCKRSPGNKRAVPCYSCTSSRRRREGSRRTTDAAAANFVDLEREILAVASAEVRDYELRACAAAENLQRRGDLRAVLLQCKSAISFKVGARDESSSIVEQDRFALVESSEGSLCVSRQVCSDRTRPR